MAEALRTYNPYTQGTIPRRERIQSSINREDISFLEDSIV